MFFLCCFKGNENNVRIKKQSRDTYSVRIDDTDVNNYSTDSCSRSNEFGNVTELYLIDKSMTVLNEQIIFTSKHIMKMWLSNNLLSSLPVEFEQLTLLSSIWLSNNMFEKLPNTLPKQIKHVYIENNNISSIQGVEHYLLLETLKIDCCKVTDITDEIGYCLNLITLEAHKNLISTISPSIGKLSKLKTLSLHSNQIIEIPNDIGNLKNLSYCSLHFNDLSSLPSSMSNLSSLLRLSLHNNNVSNISCLLLMNLQVISLFRNNLTEIPAEVFAALTKCQKLAIQQNKINSIPKSIKYMTSLDTIWLFDNKLSCLPDEINELPKLQCIWIYENELRGFSNIKNCLFNVKIKSLNE